MLDSQIEQIHQRRLLQLILIATVPLIVIGVKYLIESSVLDAAILLSTAIILSFVFGAARRGMHTLASFSFILVLTLMVIVFQWTTGGLRDTSTLGLPAILVFAAMIGAYRFYSILLGLIVVNTLALGVATVLGYPFETKVSGYSLAVNVAVIVFMTGLAVRIMTMDNIRLLTQLRTSISATEKARAKVEYQAYHDYLTDLPNRLAAEEHFYQLMRAIDAGEIAEGAVIYIDFDEFKGINDSLGHNVGDQFLIQKTQQLWQQLRPGDQLCRIGGDEFLVLVSDLSGGALSEYANQFRRQVLIEVQVDSHVLSCSCSIGIVLLPKDARSYQEAVQRADIAMYSAKNSGKNVISYYQEDMGSRAQRRYLLQNQLAKSAFEKEFTLAVQPIVDIKTNAIVAAEALARWNHPIFGAISPMEFIPLAEANGTIDAISGYILGESAKLLRDIVAISDSFYLTVNISPSQLRHPQFIDKCVATVEEYGVPIHRFKFEVTESQILHSDPVFEDNLERLKSMGVGLLLDDFGTGYSNLSRLQKMAFQAIKIDKSFIEFCYKSNEKMSLLESITAMINKLGVEIVAEGIEESEELNVVAELGIAKGQGYFWSEPLSATAFLGRYLPLLKDQKPI